MRIIASYRKLRQALNLRPGRLVQLSQKPWIVPSRDTTKLHRLEANLGAIDVTLAATDFVEIATMLSKIEVQGDVCRKPGSR